MLHRGCRKRCTRPVCHCCNDLAEAANQPSDYIKCVEEHKAGNNDFIGIERDLRIMLEKSELLKVPYFLREFLSAFERMLDEITP